MAGNFREFHYLPEDSYTRRDVESMTTRSVRG